MSSIEKVFREWGLPVNFLDRYWRRTHVAGQITDRAHASGGLSELEIDSLLRQGLRSDRVSISTAGTYHHPIEYTTTKTIAGQPIADFIDPDRVRVLVERGATAILANVELWIPPVTNFAHLLADDFGCEVQAHIFLTGPERGGLVPHADGEDNFLIQITGTKTWSLWKHYGVHAQRMDSETLGAPTAAVVLTPGDVLYIPVGWVHSAIADWKEASGIREGRCFGRSASAAVSGVRA